MSQSDNKLKRIYKVSSSLAAILKCMLRQRQFLNRDLGPTLNKFETESDGTLTAKDFIKIRKYYGQAVPGILGESFCILRGYPMTKEERISSTCQGSLTGLFDDFFDDFHLPESYLRELIDIPEQIETRKSNELLYLYFYQRCLKNSQDSQLVKQYFHQVLDAQTLSLNQVKSETTTEEINATTLFKGGISVVYYRTVFGHNMDKAEEEAMYALGSLGQLGNDLFDVYKDLQGGIRTAVTETKDIKPIREWYNFLVNDFYEKSRKMNYPKQNIERFLHFISVGIERITICVDQLEAVQQSSQGIFQPETYERKQLICDLEKTSNIIKWLKYSVQNQP